MRRPFRPVSAGLQLGLLGTLLLGQVLLAPDASASEPAPSLQRDQRPRQPLAPSPSLPVVSPRAPQPPAGPLRAPEGAAVEPLAPNEPAALRWPGRRFAWYDYSYTGALAVGATVELILPIGANNLEEQHAHQGGVLFDDAVRDALVLGGESERHRVGMLSNITLGLLVAYPLVIDGALVSWAIKDSPDVAWQSTMINIQAFAFTSLLTGTIKRIADRQRPIATECLANPGYDSDCSTSGQHYSFPSGHTSIAFTSASLMCLHHAELGLYGRAGDAIACASGMLAASITGWSRIAADKHYLSDVLSGAAIGGLSGGLLPWLLYYQFDVLDASADTALVPSLSPDNLGLRWAGRF